MPTAADYRTTAFAIDALGQSSGYAQYGIATIGADTGVQGGEFAAAIDRALDTTSINLGSIMGRCSDEAAEARRRAIVCDQFTADMRRYRIQLSDYESAPPEARLPRPALPTRPATWVEEG